MKRSGRTWDTLPSEFDLKELDEEGLVYFVNLAKQRLPYIDMSHPEIILENLGLLNERKLTNAAVLLFSRNPQKIYPLSQVRMGVFRENNILDSHIFQGTLWRQLDNVIKRFREILKVRFEIKADDVSVKGLQRIEIWEYPLEALREIVINALIHRDYTYPADIQIRLYDNRLEVWNPGELLSPLTPEDLYVVHNSIPRNPLIAQIFYFAGMVERWGTGTIRVVQLCKEQGLPKPLFENWQGGLLVTLNKDLYSTDQLYKIGLNERQIKAVLYVKENGSITNQIYREINNVSDETARLDLKFLVSIGLFTIRGKGKKTIYVLR